LGAGAPIPDHDDEPDSRVQIDSETDGFAGAGVDHATFRLKLRSEVPIRAFSMVLEARFDGPEEGDPADVLRVAYADSFERPRL